MARAKNISKHVPKSGFIPAGRWRCLTRYACGIWLVSCCTESLTARGTTDCCPRLSLQLRSGIFPRTGRVCGNCCGVHPFPPLRDKILGINDNRINDFCKLTRRISIINLGVKYFVYWVRGRRPLVGRFGSVADGGDAPQDMADKGVSLGRRILNFQRAEVHLLERAGSRNSRACLEKGAGVWSEVREWSNPTPCRVRCAERWRSSLVQKGPSNSGTARARLILADFRIEVQTEAGG
jgi:hypothetical protein